MSQVSLFQSLNMVLTNNWNKNEQNNLPLATSTTTVSLPPNLMFLSMDEWFPFSFHLSAVTIHSQIQYRIKGNSVCKKQNYSKLLIITLSGKCHRLYNLPAQPNLTKDLKRIYYSTTSNDNYSKTEGYHTK